MGIAVLANEGREKFAMKPSAFLYVMQNKGATHKIYFAKGMRKKGKAEGHIQLPVWAVQQQETNMFLITYQAHKVTAAIRSG